MSKVADFSAFKNKRIAILGDIMVDEYWVGQVTRISPEAPVPIVNLEREDYRLGGAANVALNIISLGAQAIVCSVIGTDTDGTILSDLLTEHQISDAGVIRSNTRKTTVKKRIIGNNQQLLRIDSEQTNPISSEEEDALIKQVTALIESGIDALIFEDYNKGILTPRVITEIIALCKEHGVITTVDPKKENFFAYRGVDLFKPNLKELKEGVNVPFDLLNKETFEHAVALLEEKLGNKISFITLSEHGVFIKSDSEKHYIAAHQRNITDVSGAGDTVISVATLCMTIGMTIDELAKAANLAGGLVCERMGVVSIDLEQLTKEFHKIH